MSRAKNHFREYKILNVCDCSITSRKFKLLRVNAQKTRGKSGICERIKRMTGSTETLMTRSFVARELEVSECTVDNLAKSGRLPSIMTTSKRRVFRKADVEACKAGLRTARGEPVEAA